MGGGIEGAAEQRFASRRKSSTRAREECDHRRISLALHFCFLAFFLARFFGVGAASADAASAGARVGGSGRKCYPTNAHRHPPCRRKPSPLHNAPKGAFYLIA